MKTVMICALVALSIGAASATADEVYYSRPLVQAQFNRLIPTSYPTLTTRFNRLRPTIYPVIRPAVPRLHIVENLVRPMEQPILRVY